MINVPVGFSLLARREHPKNYHRRPSHGCLSRRKKGGKKRQFWYESRNFRRLADYTLITVPLVDSWYGNKPPVNLNVALFICLSWRVGTRHVYERRIESQFKFQAVKGKKLVSIPDSIELTLCSSCDINDLQFDCWTDNSWREFSSEVL